MLSAVPLNVYIRKEEIYKENPLGNILVYRKNVLVRYNFAQWRSQDRMFGGGGRAVSGEVTIHK
jgi:hypothetical protein